MPKGDFIPADATLKELEAQAEELQQQASKAQEPEASLLREKAQLCLGWMKSLRVGGPWTS